MKVSREQAAENRRKIVEVAARLFREKGFDGIGVADLMKQAGFTHGGFYGHFESKEALIAEAGKEAGRGAGDALRDAAHDSERPLAGVIDNYLSQRHRDAPGSGCVMATLGAEVPRHGGAVRHGVTEGVKRTVGYLAELMPAGDDAGRRTLGIACFATLIGAMVMARAVDDSAFSDDILQAVSGWLKDTLER